MSSDHAFRQQYAEALAKAIKDSENAPIETNAADLTLETYQQLCYDYPTNLTARGCHLLGTALSSPQSSLRPSERLIQGVIQLTDRFTQEHSSEQTSTNADEGLIETSNSRMAQDPDFAALVWILFGKIPLNAILASTVEEAAECLGSFRGSKTEQDEPTSLSEVLNGQQIPSDVEDEKQVGENVVANGGCDHDSLEEVFAAESDPSDFEFESDRQIQLAEVDEMISMNPTVLSRVPIDTEWQDIEQAITSLLQFLNHSRIFSMTRTQWKDLKVSESLTQLILILMVPSETPDGVLASRDSVFWQKLGLVPLHVFRDVCLARLSMDAFLFSAYLDLLHTLVRVDSTSSRNPSQTKLHVATSVGLSALSALSENILEYKDKQTRVQVFETLKATVVEICDDLALCLEKSVGSDAESAIPWTMMPILRVLSKPSPRINSTALTSAQSQIILNSGLAPQWISCLQREWAKSESSETADFVERELFHLCVASPSLIGRYVWRYPSLAASLTKTDEEKIDDSKLVDVILWNMLAQTLAAKSNAGKVVWKSKSSATEAPRDDTCRALAWKAIQELFQGTAIVLNTCRERRSTGCAKETICGNQRSLVLDLCRWIDEVTDQSLRELLLLIRPMEEVRGILRTLQECLLDFPAAEDSVEGTTKEKVENGEDLGRKKPSSSDDKVLNDLRKYLKSFQSFLEQPNLSNVGSSKTD